HPQQGINIITTEELLEYTDDKATRIIDVRSPDAYNGWRLHNESRGGHIPGASNLHFKWTEYIDWIEIVRNKGINQGDRLIIYGYSSDDAMHVAERFLKAGYDTIFVYTGFAGEWLPDDRLPLDRLQRYDTLVPASWVHSLISGERPVEYDNDSFIIVHAHYRNRDAYLGGHIPGAIDMDTLALESPETWNRRSPEELQKALEEHGITAGTTVILYGKFMSPDNNDPFPGSAAGDIGAIRLALIMMYAGVKDVRVLNGGFQSWQDAGYDISKEDIARKPVKSFGAEIPALPGLFVDTDEAKQMLESPGSELVCVRSLPEYRGEVSGYNYIEPKGRIPGAVFADCGTDAYHMENYRNLDHTTREYGEIEEIWKDAGISPDKHLAFYCGTGWRGSEAWFNAWLMGWPRVSVYDGGWFEWSSDPDNPFETDVEQI
ncbi:MAG: rhodanese-like domain-containing protein, partial [Bacteroidales bacterium]|nr:rhodanese-like domain-containing protein [Bacteroidales bacterium]